MKMTHLLAILVVAVAIGIIVVSAGDASQYVNFSKAKEMAKDGNEDKVHVVGQLLRNPQGQVEGIDYDPFKDPNFIAFRLQDDQGKVFRVVSNRPPASIEDLKKSEKVVIVGRFRKEEFYASEILMKCPSKYEEKEIKM